MPDPTMLTALYAWLAAGVCAVVLGVFGLLARRPRPSSRPWLAPLLLAVATGLIAVGVAVSSPHAAWPPAALALVALTLALFRTGLPRATATVTLAVLAQPRAQSVLLLVVGVAVLGWQSWALTRSLEQEMEETDRHLITFMSPTLEAYGALTSRTDIGTPIPLWQVTAGDESDGDQEREFLRRLHFDVKLIQTDGPDPRYNCHGWVFTGGQAWVRGASVEEILRDHDYQPVTQPSPGDVAVYRQHSGEVTHTAVVRGFAADGTPLLESKWGKIGRFIHLATEHAYKSHACKYYRTPRPGGHVLQTAKAE